MRLSTVEMPKMGLLGARRTKEVNILRILCPCGNVFDHRADRKKMRCRRCGRIGDSMQMKREYPIGKKL